MSDSQQIGIYSRFKEYDFEHNAEFQAGLPSLLSQEPGEEDTDPEEREALIDRAKWFYFTRTTGLSFELEEYKTWEASYGNSNSTETTTSSTTPYPKTFQDIVQLIQSGATIPGIRQIPDKLAEESPSQSVMEPRQKPWEVPVTDGEQDPVGRGTGTNQSAKQDTT